MKRTCEGALGSCAFEDMEGAGSIPPETLRLGCWSSPILYLPCDAQPQTRRLYFRNLSKLNLVVKLVSSKPHVVELARSALRLEPWSSLFIEAKFMSSNVGTFDYADPKISGYAMPIYSYTFSKISHWSNTPGVETEKQLAFELNVKFNNNVFSAPNADSNLKATQRQDFSHKSESVAEQNTNINVEQEATPCGGH
uniref:Protein kinase domain-containing protein n=1 Tax=Angiostrongylus cantonensis TaxID=6313 RepID=A0A0K0DBU5_ANGCA